jgi:hypothetical protein
MLSTRAVGFVGVGFGFRFDYGKNKNLLFKKYIFL